MTSGRLCRAPAISREAIATRLKARGDEQQRLFAEARAARDAAFGPTAVVRGVIEVTSACLRECPYCPMRSGNRIER